jgi:hypothetical protein
MVHLLKFPLFKHYSENFINTLFNFYIFVQIKIARLFLDKKIQWWLICAISYFNFAGHQAKVRKYD